MSIARSVNPAITRQTYWLAVAIPLLLPAGWALRDLPGMGTIFAWLTPLVLYFLLPVADKLLGRDTHNPPAESRSSFTDTFIPVAASLCYFVILAWSLTVIYLERPSFNVLALVGWAVSLANIGGVIAINVAHELIHRRSRALQNLGGVLLACVYYGCFKLEHPRWHHVKVATQDDPSSAARGVSVYRKVPRALLLNTLCGWTLGAEAARQAGRPFWRNEMFLWYGISLSLSLAVFLFLGPLAAVIYVAHAVGAAALLEVINYVEHYGLRRNRRADGRYEPPQKHHSWDADFWLSNGLLIQLPRHADHHVNPSRPFAALQRSSEAPQLPFGYATAVLVACIPPLWYRIIHPRLDARLSAD